MIITNWQERKGEYNNIPFHNIVLDARVELPNGYRTEQFKIKKKLLDQWMEENLIDNYDYLVSKDLEFYYDKYCRIVLIQEIVSSKKK